MVRRVGVERQVADGGEGDVGPVHLGDGHGPVEGDDRRRRHPLEVVVELDDLAPVGVGGRGGVAVHGVDGGLDLERPGLVAAQARPHERLALGDLVPIPRAAVLVGEQHERSVGRRAGRPAGVEQQEQGEQPHRLGLVGHQLGQHAGQPHRLLAEVVADEVAVAAGGPVTLVVDQVQHRQHGVHAGRQLGVGGHPVRDVGVADLLLGPHDALGHRRLGHEEGVGDLGRLEPAEQAQRERDLGRRGQRRVAAREDQAQPVVVHGSLRRCRLVALVEAGGLGVSVMA